MKEEKKSAVTSEERKRVSGILLDSHFCALSHDNKREREKHPHVNAASKKRVEAASA